MSAIDTVWHEVIGQVDGIPIYRLKEDSGNKESFGFDGKKGDVLLGGGSGETPAMRISMPETLTYLTANDVEIWMKYDFCDLVKTFWSNNHAYEFIKSYIKLGYDPKECPIETWLAEHIVSFLLEKFPKEYQPYIGEMVNEDGEKNITYDGSICADPEIAWVEMNKDWFKHRN